MELSLVFQGLSSAASLVSAFKAALDVRRELSKEDVWAISARAMAQAQAEHQKAVAAAEKISGLSEEMVETIRRKIKEAQGQWQKQIADNDRQSEWVKATDRYKADSCALLRTVKQINGGLLPDEWYELWAQLGCT